MGTGCCIVYRRFPYRLLEKVQFVDIGCTLWERVVCEIGTSYENGYSLWKMVQV